MCWRSEQDVLMVDGSLLTTETVYTEEAPLGCPHALIPFQLPMGAGGVKLLHLLLFDPRVAILMKVR